mmetsp:Transcript_58239/g.103906  ORF Transcript_58239/g.103906 Transcript_58239/m.103906 type:complete len:200 (+) Transcript_58239:649-1248(+)
MTEGGFGSSPSSSAASAFALFARYSRTRAWSRKPMMHNTKYGIMRTPSRYLARLSNSASAVQKRMMAKTPLMHMLAPTADPLKIIIHRASFPATTAPRTTRPLVIAKATSSTSRTSMSVGLQLKGKPRGNSSDRRAMSNPVHPAQPTIHRVKGCSNWATIWRKMIAPCSLAPSSGFWMVLVDMLRAMRTVLKISRMSEG